MFSDCSCGVKNSVYTPFCAGCGAPVVEGASSVERVPVSSVRPEHRFGPGTVVGDYDEMIERITDGRTEYSRMMDDGRWFVVVIENDGVTMVSAWWDRRRSRRQRGR